MKSGSVYRRGNSWCISYYIRGRRYRETLKVKTDKQAQKILDERLLQGSHQKKFTLHLEAKIGFEKLQPALTAEYKRQKRASIDSLKYHFAHLDTFFRPYSPLKLINHW